MSNHHFHRLIDWLILWLKIVDVFSVAIAKFRLIDWLIDFMTENRRYWGSIHFSAVVLPLLSQMDSGQSKRLKNVFFLQFLYYFWGKFKLFLAPGVNGWTTSINVHQYHFSFDNSDKFWIWSRNRERIDFVVAFSQWSRMGAFRTCHSLVGLSCTSSAPQKKSGIFVPTEQTSTPERKKTTDSFLFAQRGSATTPGHPPNRAALNCLQFYTLLGCNAKEKVPRFCSVILSNVL